MTPPPVTPPPTEHPDTRGGHVPTTTPGRELTRAERDQRAYREQSVGDQCVALACRTRRPDAKPDQYWDDYGTCGRRHAIDYFGEDCVDVHIYVEPPRTDEPVPTTKRAAAACPDTALTPIEQQIFTTGSQGTVQAIKSEWFSRGFEQAHAATHDASVPFAVADLPAQGRHDVPVFGPDVDGLWCYLTEDGVSAFIEAQHVSNVRAIGVNGHAAPDLDERLSAEVLDGWTGLGMSVLQAGAGLSVSMSPENFLALLQAARGQVCADGDGGGEPART